MSSRISQKPTRINEHNWYYENKKSIDVIHEVRGTVDGEYIRTDTIRIPLQKLLDSIARMKS